MSCTKIKKYIPNLFTYQNFLELYHKNKFKSLANKLNLSVPRNYSYNEAIKQKKFLFKPVDSHSGKGIKLLQKPSKESLNTYISKLKNISKESKYLLEEYIEGQLYSHSAFFSNNRIIRDFFVKEDCIANKFAVDVSCLEPNINTKVKVRIRAQIKKLAAFFNVSDCLIHTQFILDNHTFNILEITCRYPGDLYSLLIKFSTGYDYAKSYILPFLNKRNSVDPDNNDIRYIIRYTIFLKQGERYTGIKFNSPCKIIAFLPLLNLGHINNSDELQRLAIIFFESDNANDHLELYQKILSNNIFV